ncbi:hypothetical protein PITC_052000 [Penicillium italicum]|uniref:Uncharacterized protein n=1 Tax=Penicillium italicum TaxID=40296 RepID=A0A0A2KUN8_PENIT|nr:hypothetical protein PITC_052000 [Penicillium italicum]
MNKYIKFHNDPHTAEKIEVLIGPEVLPTLREYVDDVNIPVKFRGRLQFTNGMLPDLDDIVQQLLNSDSATPLPPGPLEWIQGPHGRRTALAVGSKASSERSNVIAILDEFG